MHPILDSQWGFNQASPLLLQLLATVDNWLRICDEGGEIGGLFFDIQKAFDSVPHEALMAKLQQAGLNSNILGNYLTCRRKTVAVNGSSSLIRLTRSIWGTRCPKDQF